MTATAPELSKSDFFDFVTSNEVTDAQYKLQMRSANVFTESDSRSNPLLSDEPKEQNNNSLLSLPTTTSGSMATTTALQSFDSIWNPDRDRDRLESAMLEDLNKYYWNQDSHLNSPHTDTAISNKLISNNTDGQIYTLTVQDLNESSTSRFWVKEEDVSISSPTDIEQNTSLDLESILDINNGFPNELDTLSSNIIPKTESFSYEEGDPESQSSNLNPETVVKVEPPFIFEASENKDGVHSPIVTQALENQIEFSENNNDWKLTDQNTESLLRSALQGKAFIRYSTIQNKTITKLDGTSELKRVIINNNNKTEVPSMYSDKQENETGIYMAINPNDGNVNISILLDDPNEGCIITNGENPSSTQSVDDILLSQLDTNYPEDYEKLKRIATELGESVSQPFCTVEPLDPTRGVYNFHHVNGELVTMIPAGGEPQHIQIVTASPTVTSTKTVNKKYKRVQNKTSPPTSQAQSGTAIQAATSTSNGVRKERSLHYCSICSKGFKDKYSVNVHVRTHTGEKPFTCSLCGKRFRQKAHLAKHYQTHIAQKNAAANGTLKTGKQR